MMMNMMMTSMMISSWWRWWWWECNTAAGSAQLLKLPTRRQFSSTNHSYHYKDEGEEDVHDNHEYDDWQLAARCFPRCLMEGSPTSLQVHLTCSSTSKRIRIQIVAFNHDVFSSSPAIVIKNGLLHQSESVVKSYGDHGIRQICIIRQRARICPNVRTYPPSVVECG